MMVGDLSLNAEGHPEAVFFVALANTEPRSVSLGFDITGPRAGAAYLSTDGGLTFAPVSTMPIIDGNAMIRADVKKGICFIMASGFRR